jgi:hypothetical protein
LRLFSWGTIAGGKAIATTLQDFTSTMGRNKKEKDAKIKLAHPDRSGLDPSQETLLEVAEKRGLLKAQQAAEEGLDESGEPLVGRLGESILWSISLTMLHFTLDVLVANQYAVAIKWPALFARTAQAFPSESKLKVESNADGISYPPPVLLLPSSSFSSNLPSKTTATNTTLPPSTTFFHQQCRCRMLSDIYHEYAWILRRHEAGAALRLFLDLVRDRTEHLLGDRELDLLRSLPETRWIFHSMNESYIWN